MPQISYLPKSFPLDSGSNLMAGAKAYWYITLTTTPKDTYTDYALSVANTNPVVADGNGIFPTTFLKNDVRYRLTLKTSADVLIYTQDDIGGPVITQAELGAILYPRTSAELAAGVTPTNYAYPPYTSFRYGAKGDGSTDDTAALQNGINAAIQAGAEFYLYQTTSGLSYKVTAALTITGRIAIRGSGYYNCQILTSSTDVFVISAGVNQVRMENFSIAIAVPYTTTPNAVNGIAINGTTATPCVYHTYRDLFLDGFGTAIKATALQDSTIDNVFTVHGKNAIIAAQLTVAVEVSNCLLTGNAAGSYGIQIGDGAAAAEGWNIVNCIIYGVDTGLYLNGSQNHQITGNQFDHITNVGVFIDGSAVAATNCNVTGNFFGMFGTGTTGIWCHNPSVASIPLGNRITANMISTYAGKTMTYGILVDGAEDRNHNISHNSVKATTYDCRVNAGVGIIVNANNWAGPGYYGAVAVNYQANAGTLISSPDTSILPFPYATIETTIAYSASMTLDCNLGNSFIITATNSTAFTINAPTNPTIKRITITIRAAAALGVATWDAAFKMTAWTQPASGNSRAIDFEYNGAAWIEKGRTAADIPN
jgi:hypothetical protein